MIPGKRTLIIAFLACCVKTFLFGQSNDLKAKLNSYFDENESLRGSEVNSRTPGATMIITIEDSIILNMSYGLADLDNEIPITSNTLFDVASLSKQFIGMAIAILEEKGEISIDDKLIKYIPDMPAAMNEITIRHLLHHTSGIRDWPILFALKGWQVEDSLTSEQILNLLKKQDGLSFVPGSAFSYSNSNYNLLAQIIENVTDTTLNYWMSKNIFIPLGMVNTCYVEGNKLQSSNEAQSYVFNGEENQRIENNLEAKGSSSLKSNAIDMSKWVVNFYKKQVGGEKIIGCMTKAGSLNDNKAIEYGYGLFLSEIQGQKVYFHDGAWAGFRSCIAFYPEKNIGIVILSNNGLLQPRTVLKDIATIVFEDMGIKETEANHSTSDDSQINEEFFKLCAGKYEQLADKGFYLTFFKKNEDYFVDINGRGTAKLYARSDSVFYIKEAKAEFVFHLDNGIVNSHTLKQNGKSYKAVRVSENVKHKKVDYKDFVGFYYSKELDVKYELKFDHNVLKVQIPSLTEGIIIENIEHLSFKSNTGLIHEIVFVKEKNKINGFIINNPRAKKLYFEKLKE